MLKSRAGKPNILYVFGGEKAQGAEIVIERLMMENIAHTNTHLMLSPGNFADELIKLNKPYRIKTLDQLKKLNRSTSGKLSYMMTAFKNYLTVSPKIFRYVKKEHIDILHVNTVVPASYLLPLIWYAKIFRPSLKCCWSDHDMKYFSKSDMILSKLCAISYQYTFVVSDAVKKKYGPNHKVLVLYNGLDVAMFRENLTKRYIFRSKFNIDKNACVIGLAAAINPDKGQLSLMKVFDKISLNFPKAKLVLAGGYASHFPEYGQKVANEISKNKQIIYAGFVSSMNEFYNGCDIIINNSNNTRSESLGTTIYEAMACSKIVLASNTGGTPEIITDKKDGYLFEPEDETGLYDNLTFVLENYDKLNAVRLAARNKVESKFNILVMVSKYNSILNIKKLRIPMAL